MFRINKERVKTYLLIILVVGSLAQLGILWDFVNHRLPFNFLSSFFPKNSQTVAISADKLKEDSFKPFRIIVSEGYDESHWILAEGKNDESDYSLLLNELKSYLKDIANTKASGKPILVEDAEKQWDKVIQSKVFIYEYKTNIKLSLLTQFLAGVGYYGDDSIDTYKIALSPWEDINEHTNTVYILDEETGTKKLYKYSIPMASKKLARSNYDDIIKKLNKASEGNTIRNFSIFKEVNPGENSRFLFPVRKDIPVAVLGSKFEAYPSLNSNIPQGFEKKKEYTIEELKSRADIILGSERHNYDLSEDIYGNIVFKNLNSMYRIYGDGILEYKYLSDVPESDKGNEITAFEKAIEFIIKAKLLPQSAEIYLSGIQYDLKDRYRITFDYKIGELPVFYNYKLDGKDISYPGSLINNAITVEVNSKRVLNCWWMLRSFDILKDGKKQYDILFSDFMDLALSKEYYAGLKSSPEFSIKDIDISYEVANSTGNVQKLDPSWVITTEKGKHYSVPMKAKK